VRANQTLRAKTALVNSIFLVQLRKKQTQSFCRLTMIKQRVSDTRLLCNTTAVFVKTAARRKNPAACAAVFSTMRTQEMQKGGDRLTVVPCEVLGMRLKSKAPNDRSSKSPVSPVVGALFFTDALAQTRAPLFLH